jgi:hypothetical protein
MPAGAARSSMLRRAGALLIEQNDEWLVARRYLSQESLELILVDEPVTAAARTVKGAQTRSCSWAVLTEEATE